MSNTIPSTAPRRLIELNEQWKTLAETRLPRSEDLPFDALVGSHPGIGLLEPICKAPDQDFLVLQIGPEHEARTRRDLTGMAVSKVMPSSLTPWVLKVYRETLAAGQPRYMEMLSCVYGLEPLDCCRLILPLFDDKGQPSRLLDSWVWYE